MKKMSFTNKHRSLLTIALFIAGFYLSSCQKEVLSSPVENTSAGTAANPLTKYEGLSSQTMWELQQARAASSKYQNIDNAIADGYVDIAVDVENMGHHFMKPTAVDDKFDLKEPEILVYNKDEKGNHQLVAVEYAVPITNPRPSGFSGDNDVWDGNTGFGLWLLHAWVWSYNPNGVFNPTNPLVHLH